MNIVYVSCKDKDEARRIAKELVEGKLAVCINIIDPTYNLPDIISWKIDKTTKEVEKWLKDETKTPPKKEGF